MIKKLELFKISACERHWSVSLQMLWLQFYMPQTAGDADCSWPRVSVYSVRQTNHGVLSSKKLYNLVYESKVHMTGSDS